MNAITNLNIAIATIKVIEDLLRGDTLSMPRTADEVAKTIRNLEAVRLEMTKQQGALEECLDWFKDRYDITDETDDDGTPHGNWEMRMGQMVEEVLGRGGF